MYRSYRFFFVVIHIFAADYRGPCENNDKGCCSGEEWNETLKMCTDCKPGYTGPSCSIKCPYPFYGLRCQMKCSPAQSKDKFDFKTGCVPEDLTTLGEFLARTNKDEDSTKSFTSEMNSQSEHQPDKAISSDFTPLQIILIALSVLFFIIFVMYLFSYKIAKPQQLEESHSEKKNDHYEDVQDLGPYP